jgi:hypothetical protein
MPVDSMATLWIPICTNQSANFSRSPVVLFRRLMRWIPVGSSRFVPLVNFLVREIILEVVGQGVAAG